MLHFVLLTCYLSSPVHVVSSSDPCIVTVVARLPASEAHNLPSGRVNATNGQKWLSFVLAIPDSKTEAIPIFGTYERKGTCLTFSPRYRLVAGETYRAILSVGSREVCFDYLAPKRTPAPRAMVTAVYPSAEKLPANLLKFYVHFSKPMRETPAIFEHIRIKNEKGEVVEDPWRRTELWNEDATRLTLWIHPGRIKEGVNLREEFGPVLKPGQKYTLEVSDQLQDSSGNRIAAVFKKAFQTTDAIQTPIALSEWQLMTPKLSTRRPLQILFPYPLDHALLGQAITVRDENDQPVMGHLALGEGEQSCLFVPERPWQKGAYRVKVADRLEDLAGNSISRPFDRNLDVPLPQNPKRSLSFQIE